MSTLTDWDLHRLLRTAGLDHGDGVWIARYPDCSGLAAFATEIEALRYAVEHNMEVVHVPWGEDIRAYPSGGSTR